jgi:DNA-binding transcriptional regulator YdaS (Cro superfamily)
MRPGPIKLAIEKAGSVKALASRIGITPQSVSQWRRVPVEHVRAIEAITGLPKHEIRADVFDAPSE